MNIGEWEGKSIPPGRDAGGEEWQDGEAPGADPPMRPGGTGTSLVPGPLPEAVCIPRARGPFPAETLVDSDAGEQPSAGPACCPVAPGLTPREGHGFAVLFLLSACSKPSRRRLREAQV